MPIDHRYFSGDPPALDGACRGPVEGVSRGPGTPPSAPTGATPVEPCHSGTVDLHDLASLAEHYGDALVNLEQFATLSGVSVSGLRSRSSRDDRDADGPPFPGAVLRPSGGLEYRLGDLVDWLTSLGVVGAADDELVATWALDEAIARCTAELGADATVGLLGAGALAVAGGWRPDPDSGPKTSLVGQLRRTFTAAAPASPSVPTLPPGFVPDPDPATDPEVGRGLLAGLPSRSTRLVVADRVVAEVVRARMAVPGDAGFVEVVERRLLPRAGDPTARTRTTAPSDAELLVALADVRPGQVVLDPALGTGTTLIEAVRLTASRNGLQTIGVEGRELDPSTWLLAKVRFGLRGIAHRFGVPGADSLDDDSLTGPFDRIVTDPDPGSREVPRWCERLVELLAPDGLAVAQFGVTDVMPQPRSAFRRRWWSELLGTLAAIVVTTRASRVRSGVGFFVIRRNASRPVLFVQAHPPPPGRPDDERSAPRDWCAALASVVTDGVARPERVTPGWHGDAFVTPMHDLTLDSLGPVHWDDLEVVRRAKEEAHGRRSAAAPEPGLVMAMPADGETDREFVGRARPVSKPGLPDDPIRDEALRAVAFLRFLVDVEAPPVDDVRFVVSPKNRARYAAEATEEMRRALKRLEQRLRGEERRGRPRQSDPG